MASICVVSFSSCILRADVRVSPVKATSLVIAKSVQINKSLVKKNRAHILRLNTFAAIII